jgi:hypothetical protein
VLYVEPLYLAAEGGSSIPELKRVIVAYSDQVVMEPTLEDALNAIFSGNSSGTAEAASSGATPTTASASARVPTSLENLIQQANQHYEAAQQDLRQGNWAGYGQEIQKLGEILKQMPAKQQ